MSPFGAVDVGQVSMLAGALTVLIGAVGGFLRYWLDRSGKLLSNAEEYAEKYVRLADQDAARVRVNAEADMARVRLEAEAEIASLKLRCDTERAELEDKLKRVTYDRDYLAAKLLALGDDLEP